MALEPQEAADEMRRLSTLLEAGLDAMRRFAVEYADAEAHYREAKAKAWVACPRTEDGKAVVAKEREAIVDANTAKERRARDIADSMRQAALESVRSRRAQISAMQTLLRADVESDQVLRYGQTG